MSSSDVEEWGNSACSSDSYISIGEGGSGRKWTLGGNCLVDSQDGVLDGGDGKNGVVVGGTSHGDSIVDGITISDK